MKKFTTNQWLVVGGVVLLAWMLYSKKAKTATAIKEEMEQDFETGGFKPMPTKLTKSDCDELEKKWLQYSMTVKFRSPEERDRQYQKFMGDCAKRSMKGTSILPNEKIAVVTR